MSGFSSITIIYNPNSTGNGEALARELADELGKLSPAIPAQLRQTEHAGHAEELAQELGSSGKRPLILSASGDGGYNEVVNGVMTAMRAGSSPTAGLLPAGNANDHYHALHEAGTVQQIASCSTRRLDLLKLSVGGKEKSWERYAHSYIGIGLTPKVGEKLNDVKLNRFNEVWLSLRTLLRLTPVRIRVDGKLRRLDSLVASNIPRMSKVLTLAPEASPVDARFELTAVAHRSKLGLLGHLAKAATLGLDGTDQRERFSFTAVGDTKVQLDGEIRSIPAGSTVTIAIEPAALDCIV